MFSRHNSRQTWPRVCFQTFHQIFQVYLHFITYFQIYFFIFMFMDGSSERQQRERQSKEAKNFMYGMCKVDMNVPKSKSSWSILAFTLQLHTSVGVLVSKVQTLLISPCKKSKKQVLKVRFFIGLQKQGLQKYVVSQNYVSL